MSGTFFFFILKNSPKLVLFNFFKCMYVFNVNKMILDCIGKWAVIVISYANKTNFINNLVMGLIF